MVVQTYNKEISNLEVPPKLEKESLLRKYDIPIDHLDFKYVETCTNARELEHILLILRSGEEGYYHQLLKFTEARLFTINPKSKLLRTTVPVLTKRDVSAEEWKNVSSDLQDWIENVTINDKELSSFHDVKSTVNNASLPVRHSKSIQNHKSTVQKSSRIKSMDYEAWDKLDVDTEILKMDIEEEKLKEESLKLAKKKEELNTIKINPDLMSQTELKHSALQAKNYGNESFRSGDYKEALQCYTNSLLYSETAVVYNNRAATYIKLKRYKDAISDCNEVLKLEPYNEKALFRKGEALNFLTKFDEALVYLEKLIKINPNNKDAQNLIAKIKKETSKETSAKSVRLTIQEHKSNDNENSPPPKKKTPEKEASQELVRVLLPVPSTSSCNGPSLRLVEVPRSLAQKLTNTKKTLGNSDEKVIDLNKVQEIRSKKKPKEEVIEYKIQEIVEDDRQETSEGETEEIRTVLWEIGDSLNGKWNNQEENKEDFGEPVSITDEENFTPFEFVKCWQSIKYDKNLVGYEKLLRLLHPQKLVEVLGNKMDGEMFSTVLKCLVARFMNEEDVEFVAQLLAELVQLPRITILLLFMDEEEKVLLSDLFRFLKSQNIVLSDKVQEIYSAGM